MTRWGKLSLLLVLVGLAVAGYAHLNDEAIPGDRIPIHWGINGQPNGWVSKDQPFLAFYLLPVAFGGVIALGLFALPWLSPRNFAVESFRATYDYVFFLVAALLLYLEVVVLLGQFEGGQLSERWLVGGMFPFFALIGNVMGKVRKNFWMGIRTPWTLASERVWNQTHRVAAWLYVTVGLAGFVSAMVGIPLVICIVFLTVGALTPVVYSLVLYKRLEREGKLEEQQATVATK